MWPSIHSQHCHGIAWAIAKRTGSANKFNSEYDPGKCWWSNFWKRHPKLILRKSDKLDRCQVEADNAEVADKYLDLLENVLQENNLVNALYNCDKTFALLDTIREKVTTCVLPGPKYVRP